MSATTNTLVQTLWSYCDVLRDDGMRYGDYVEQLTWVAGDLSGSAIE